MRDVHIVRLPDAVPVQKDVAVDVEPIKAQVGVLAELIQLKFAFIGPAPAFNPLAFIRVITVKGVGNFALPQQVGVDTAGNRACKGDGVPFR